MDPPSNGHSAEYVRAELALRFERKAAASLERLLERYRDEAAGFVLEDWRYQLGLVRARVREFEKWVELEATKEAERATDG